MSAHSIFLWDSEDTRGQDYSFHSRGQLGRQFSPAATAALGQINTIQKLNQVWGQ